MPIVGPLRLALRDVFRSPRRLGTNFVDPITQPSEAQRRVAGFHQWSLVDQAVLALRFGPSKVGAMLKALNATVAALFIAASLACAEDPRVPEPYAIGGGLLTCPVGFLIHEGSCLPWVKGPVTEYGCIEYVCRGSGVCDARTVAECGSVMARVGNIGDFGAPVVSLVAPGSAFVGPVIGVAALRGRR